jgi:hypothetical protein
MLTLEKTQPIVAEYLSLAEQYPHHSIPWKRWAYFKLMLLREQYRAAEGYDESDVWMGLPEVSPPDCP